MDEDVIEINFIEMFHVLLKNIQKIIICMLIGVLIATLVTVFLIDKKYESSSRIYLMPNVDETGKIDYSSINSSNLMVKNYISIIQSDTIIENVADKLNIKSSDIKKGLSVNNEDDTQIIVISCKSLDPELSKDIVENIENEFINKMKSNLSVTNMEILDFPKADNTPVSPNRMKNMIIGGLIGTMLSVGYIIIRFMTDKRLKTGEAAERILGLPVLGIVPIFEDK